VRRSDKLELRQNKSDSAELQFGVERDSVAESRATTEDYADARPTVEGQIGSAFEGQTEPTVEGQTELVVEGQTGAARSIVEEQTGAAGSAVEDYARTEDGIGVDPVAAVEVEPEADSSDMLATS